ncbi:hypothetical protein QJS10_CPA10g00017 [Acorus calamus]|uniref:Uncharacterized protein n=1 Tax=Acorus calamus TaxID=4465 RepID=A0AAV9DW64_ACOCL|nr:hypothetical protein QJS10_CPA10g00017 [Acorus calamus]
MTGLLKKLLSCGARSFPPSDDDDDDELPECGRIRVCVGKEEEEELMMKMEVEANYLNHPLFEDLLRMSVEQYGYSYKGALRIPCETGLFLLLKEMLDTRNPSAHYMGLQDLISKYHSINNS